MGGLVLWGSAYLHKTVTSQLAAQQITFPSAQLLTGQQAEAYADHFIAQHVADMSRGKTYSQLSTEAQAQPNKAQLQTLVGTVFKGDTLRSMLLNAYGCGPAPRSSASPSSRSTRPAARQAPRRQSGVTFETLAALVNAAMRGLVMTAPTVPGDVRHRAAARPPFAMRLDNWPRAPTRQTKPLSSSARRADGGGYWRRWRPGRIAAASGVGLAGSAGHGSERG